jgi:hypothetical protein
LFPFFIFTFFICSQFIAHQKCMHGMKKTQYELWIEILKTKNCDYKWNWTWCCTMIFLLLQNSYMFPIDESFLNFWALKELCRKAIWMSKVTSRFMHVNVTIMSSYLVIFIAFRLPCNLHIKQGQH